ncbi:MAG: xanthine dehydrogenase family protein molybdopterin-binding subunit [Nitrososphaerota archaeon]|nr:xanthine dehydrogenase family protein molybdopterin-binding subunit [Nitrososphaerota archaeon]
MDDIRLPAMLHAAVLRSSYAHAMITKIDVSRSLSMPGVRAVITSADLPQDLKLLSTFETDDGSKIDRPVLAADEVRYVGEQIAFVVADSIYEAEDAVESIGVHYRPLDVVIDPAVAAKDDSPKCHAGIESNVVASEKIESGDVEREFSKAEKIVRVDLLNQRLSPTPMEPRGSVAQYDDGSGILTLWISTQGPFQNRSDLAEILHMQEDKIRVIVPDVGGGFGAKMSAYPEEVLVCLAAKWLKRPIKWIESRSENFASMTHGRGQLQHVELASTISGRILGLKVKIIGDSGAYASQGSTDATFTLRMCPGQYSVPAYRGEALVVLTNKVPHDAYRGASRPEATYLIERAIDELARVLHIDPVEIRLLNFIPREEFPFKTVGNLKYDTGDYSMNLNKAVKVSRYNEWRNYQKKARQEGRLIGVGLATYVEICGFGPDFPQTAAITVNESGRVTVISGTSPHGQGHETPLAQIVADRLGLTIDEISVNYGDTAMLPWGTFTAGSRSAALGGAAVMMSAEKIKDKMAKIASKVLDVPFEDINFADGNISSGSDPKKRLSFAEVASLAYKPRKLPNGMEPVLFAFSCFAPPTFTFPFGTHLAVAEIDRATGRIDILDYASVDDCGRVLNPMIVEGQIHGGIVQGLGQALLEDVSYNSEGQLLTSSFLDYQIPEASDVPNIRSFRTETPTHANPLGIKGIGEAGTIAATPAVANAVSDALSELGAQVERMPLSMRYIKCLIEKSVKR